MAFPTSQNANVTNLLIVTWDSVGYYDGHTDKVEIVYPDISVYSFNNNYTYVAYLLQ